MRTFEERELLKLKQSEYQKLNLLVRHSNKIQLETSKNFLDNEVASEVPIDRFV